MKSRRFVPLLLASMILMLATHRSALAEPCRLIVNWDEINMWLYQMRWAQATSERTLTSDEVKTLIEDIVDEHAQAQVDRLAICVCSFPWGTNTAGFESINRAEQRGWMTSDANIAPAMIEFDDKYDINEVVLRRAQQHGMQFIACIRMNDRHPKSNETPFFRDHPEWRLRELSAGMDYKHEGVRRAVLSIIQEVLRKHDVDGIEIDWMRHCHMFNPSEAAEHAPLLTEMLVAVRGMLDQAAERRHCEPLVLGVRVPQTIGECRVLGFDLDAWVQEGGIDYICPSDFMYFDANIKVDEFASVTEGTSCQVFPTISAGLSHADRRRGLSPMVLRAAAHNYYSFGASGVSAYNFYNQYRIVPGNEWRKAVPDVMLTEWPQALASLTALRDPAVVSNGDKHYLFHPLWRSREYHTGVTIYDLIELHRDGTSPADTIRLRVADNLGSPEFSATLEFKATGMSPDDVLQISLNGTTVLAEQLPRTFDSDGQNAQEGRELPPFFLYRLVLRPDLARLGDNYLTARLKVNAGTEKVELQEFQILVRDLR